MKVHCKEDDRFSRPQPDVINYPWVGNTIIFFLHCVEANMNLKLFRLQMCVSLYVPRSLFWRVVLIMQIVNGLSPWNENLILFSILSQCYRITLTCTSMWIGNKQKVTNSERLRGYGRKNGAKFASKSIKNQLLWFLWYVYSMHSGLHPLVGSFTKLLQGTGMANLFCHKKV
jgi:hypothetical protein